ncbi:hypothetical protein cypCar_00050333 [Cyprinus carpio]|nr:hypothetical protein cypCar_00050333 [Cyprinus carpio]
MPRQLCHRYESVSLRLSLSLNLTEPHPVNPLSPSRVSPGRSTARGQRLD